MYRHCWCASIQPLQYRYPVSLQPVMQLVWKSFISSVHLKTPGKAISLLPIHQSLCLRNLNPTTYWKEYDQKKYNIVAGFSHYFRFNSYWKCSVYVKSPRAFRASPIDGHQSFFEDLSYALGLQLPEFSASMHRGDQDGEG